MKSFCRAILISLLLTSLLLQCFGIPNPKLKVDVKVDINGKEVIHETHPKAAKARMMMDSKAEGTFPSNTVQKMSP